MILVQFFQIRVYHTWNWIFLSQKDPETKLVSDKYLTGDLTVLCQGDDDVLDLSED